MGIFIVPGLESYPAMARDGTRDSASGEEQQQGEQSYRSVPRRTVLKGIAAMSAAAFVGSEGAFAVPVDTDDITKQDALDSIDYDLEHPRAELTPEMVETAKWNAENTEWGAITRDAIVERAETMPGWQLNLYFDGDYDASFVEMSEAEITNLQPIQAPDGKYYYGFPFRKWLDVSNGNVCPIDGSPLVNPSFTEPGHWECEEHGHMLPGTHDGIEIVDEGDGWVVPPDVPDDWAASNYVGDRFYIVAKWNGWMARLMYDAVLSLAYAYALTDEDKYGEAAALCLDTVATVTPDSHDVVIDYTGDGGGPALNFRVGYQNGHEGQDLAISTDLLLAGDVLERESPTNPGVSMKRNVAENLLVEIADFCWRDMHGGTGEHEHADYSTIYHNGTMTYMEGMVYPASVLGIDAGYAEFFLDGQVSLSNFLSNTVFRDGTYYETSGFYDQTYLAPAEVAYFLENETYPNGRDFYDNPRFINLNIEGAARESVAGREPAYGDVNQPDLGKKSGPVHGNFEAAERFYARADDAEEATYYAQKCAEIYGGDPNEKLANPTAGYPPGGLGYWEIAEKAWPLFNLKNGIQGFDLSELGDREPRDSELLPGKGMALLRPESALDSGLMMRYGPTLSHGHYDSLGLWLYGGGRELSYDPGRHPQAQMQESWFRQTVAHNTVTVNETPQNPPEADGGSVNLFADRDGYSLVDVSNEQEYAHEDVDVYRRTTAFVDDPSGEESYTVDIFRVDGHETADFSFHGQGIEFETDLSLSDPAPGSLASPDYFWGDKVKESGYIEGFEDEGFWFNAPPGNGYGFLGHPRTATGEDSWSATWRVAASRDEAQPKLRLTMLGDDDREVNVAQAPDPMVWKLGHDHETEDLQYVVARDQGESPSQFVSVIEAVGTKFPVESVESLDVPGTGNDTFDDVALKVTLADGTIDYYLSTLSDDPFLARDGKINVQTDADFAMIRVEDGTITQANVEGGSKLRANVADRPLVVTSPVAETTATIREVDSDNPSFLVDGDLPTGDTLAGQYLLVDAPEYSHNCPYLVESVEPEGDGFRVNLAPTAMDIARATVGEKKDENTIKSPARFPLLGTENKYIEGPDANEYLDGRLVENRTNGATTTVADAKGDLQTLELTDGSDFHVTDNLVVWDVKAGDEITVPLSASLTRTADGFEVTGVHDLSVTSTETSERDD